VNHSAKTEENNEIPPYLIQIWKKSRGEENIEPYNSTVKGCLRDLIPAALEQDIKLFSEAWSL